MRIAIALAALLAAGAAHAADCDIALKGDDNMKFDQRSITVDASCKSVTIHLVHTGRLPAATMGHNVVITTTDAFQAVAQDGIKAGLAGDYIKAGDTRVIAHTKIIGGGESTTTAFAGSMLKAGGAYTFFCSAPGHSSLMRGQLIVR